MRKIRNLILITLVAIIGIGFNAGAKAATQQEALNFFESYVTAANSYSSSLLGMYATNATIIRQIIKPNGQLANATFKMSDYRHQMIVSSHLAKIRHYKNYYSNIRAIKENGNSYKIEANRTPSTGGGKLKVEVTVTKTGNKWLITRELMQT